MYNKLKSIATDLLLKTLSYKFENSTNKLFYLNSPGDPTNTMINITNAIIKIRKGESTDNKRLVLNGKEGLVKAIENAIVL